MPKPLSIIKYISLVLGVTVIGGLVKGVTTSEGRLLDNLKEGFANAPYLFIIGPVFLLVFAVLAIYGKRMDKTAFESEELEELTEEGDALLAEIKAELSIPDDALQLDVLCYPYKVKKNGDVRPYNDFATHTPFEMFVYKADESLCIANCESVYKIPLSQITGIEKRDEKIKLMCWNKEEEINSEKYEHYKMSIDNFGIVHAKGYYSIMISSDFGEYFIDVPSYEIDAFRSIIGEEN